MLRRFYATFRKHSALFTKQYRQKTAAEFKDATDDLKVRKEASRAGGRIASGARVDGSDEDDEDDEDDAALDDALEAMLDAQAEADDENLFDDFDDYAD